MTNTLRSFLALSAAALAALAALAATPDSRAAGTLLPGCANQVLQRPFLPWLDPANYTLAPDGGLEARGAGWTLRGGASVVAGNEPFRVRSPQDKLSLSLPRGSWAQTPPMCIGLLHPTVRFFARGGSLLSPLAVEVVFKDPLGVTRTLPVGVALPSLSWKPTLPMLFLANLTALPVVGDAVSVSFRFRPLGGAGWLIDDVYVDPYKGR